VVDIVNTMTEDEAQKIVEWWSRPVDQPDLADSIDRLSSICHASSVIPGWWDNPRNPGELIALMHSELSEALEGIRKDAQDDHLPEFKSVEVELADALIRIFDYAGAANLRLGEAFVAKLAYNAQRADHKRENRAKVGGKSF